MMRGIIIHSVRLNDNETLPYDAFLLSDKEARPTRFEMSFVDGTDKFTYGFSYTAKRIEEEWLVAKFPKRSLKTLLRRTQNTIEIDEQNYSEGLSIKEGTIPLNNNRLFISLAAQLGGEISKRVIEWFRTKPSVIPVCEIMTFRAILRRYFIPGLIIKMKFWTLSAVWMWGSVK